MGLLRDLLSSQASSIMTLHIFEKLSVWLLIFREAKAAAITSATDPFYDIYIHHRQCISRAVMVCKQCRTSHLDGLSFHRNDTGFEIWCFETGQFENTVSPLALTLNISYSLMDINDRELQRLGISAASFKAFTELCQIFIVLNAALLP